MALNPKINHLLTALVTSLSEYQPDTSNYDGTPNQLTIARVKNVKATLDTLNAWMTDSKPDITLKQISDAITAGKLANVSLSMTHHKSHRSYNDNRALGRNPFSSWWHSDWFTSRANAKFEKCEEIIKDVAATFPKSTTPRPTMASTSSC